MRTRKQFPAAPGLRNSASFQPRHQNHLSVGCVLPVTSSHLRRLRKCTSKENRTALPASTALPHQEDDVLSTLQSRGNASELVFAVHRLLINLKNDVAAG